MVALVKDAIADEELLREPPQKLLVINIQMTGSGRVVSVGSSISVTMIQPYCSV